MKKFLLTIMLGINCLSAAGINLEHAHDRVTTRTCLEIESEFATFQESIIARGLPTDIFEAMDLVYPRVAQYYTDQASSLSAYLRKLSDQTSTLTDETDIKFNSIEIEKTNNLIEKYQSKAKHLTEKPARIQELLDFITAAYTQDSGLSQQQTLFSTHAWGGCYSHGGLFKDETTENQRSISYSYNFKTDAQKLNTAIKEKFATLISALSDDTCHTFLRELAGPNFNHFFHHLEHNPTFKTYIKRSGDPLVFAEELTSIGLTITQDQLDKLMLARKRKVIDTERKIQFNRLMRALSQSITDTIYDHIEASYKARRETR